MLQPPVQPRQSRAHSDHSRDGEVLSSPPLHIEKLRWPSMLIPAACAQLSPAMGKGPDSARLSWNPPSYSQASRNDIPEMRTWVEGEAWGRLGAQYDNFSPRPTFSLAKNSHLPSLDSGDPLHKSPRPKALPCNDLSLREGHPGELENLLVSF